jgi:hypothetical protein
MDIYAIRLFAVMFFLAVAWLVMVSFLFHVLKTRHSVMYERLGSPRGFEPRATQALVSFLASRKPESLGSSGILSLARFMRFYFIAYLACFIVLLYMVVRQQGAA